MSGIRKLPSTAGIDGTKKEEDHDHAVHGEEPIVVVGRAQDVPLRRHQLEPHHRGGRSAHEKEKRDRGHVQ